jgi:Uncharacterized protein conserved in bacteria
MRKIALSLVSVAVLGLSGCNKAPTTASPSDAAGAPAASGSAADASKVANQVSGTISLRDPAQLSANATLVLNLVDVSSSAAGQAPLASKTSPAGTFPQPFQLSFNPAQVKPDDLYVVQAELTDGDRHYTMPIQAPVLAKGSKNDGIAIQLVAEQTPGRRSWPPSPTCRNSSVR